MQIIAKTLATDPDARESLQYLLAQQYLDMGLKIGSSDSSKASSLNSSRFCS